MVKFFLPVCLTKDGKIRPAGPLTDTSDGSVDHVYWCTPSETYDTSHCRLHARPAGRPALDAAGPAPRLTKYEPMAKRRTRYFLQWQLATSFLLLPLLRFSVRPVQQQFGSEFFIARMQAGGRPELPGGPSATQTQASRCFPKAAAIEQGGCPAGRGEWRRARRV